MREIQVSFVFQLGHTTLLMTGIYVNPIKSASEVIAPFMLRQWWFRNVQAMIEVREVLYVHCVKSVAKLRLV
jgi:hypothetical protein